MIGQGPGLSLSKSALSPDFNPHRRNDKPLAIRRHVKFGIWGDTQQFQNWLVDDDAGAVSDGLQVLDHGHVITPLTTFAQRLATGPPIRLVLRGFRSTRCGVLRGVTRALC